MRNSPQYLRDGGQSMRRLRRQVWSRPALLLANCPLLKEVRRAFQVPRGDRS